MNLTLFSFMESVNEILEKINNLEAEKLHYKRLIRSVESDLEKLREKLKLQIPKGMEFTITEVK